MKKIIIIMLILPCLLLASDDSLKVYFDECAYIYWSDGGNYGISLLLGFGWYSSSHNVRVLLRPNALSDSMDNHPGVVWDSACVYLYRNGDYLGTGTYYMLVYKILQSGWWEGDGTNGVDYYQACDSINDNCPYPDLNWNTSFCQGEGTDRTAYTVSTQDSILIDTDSFPQHQFDYYFSLPDSILTNDSLSGGLIFASTSYDEGGDADERIRWASDDSTEAYWPYMMVYYTSGEPTPPDTLNSVALDSLNNDYSGENDSIAIIYTMSDQSDEGIEVVFAWSISDYPDSSNSGDTIVATYTASTTDTAYFTDELTETYKLYLTSWVHSDSGWSDRLTDTLTFTQPAPDKWWPPWQGE